MFSFECEQLLHQFQKINKFFEYFFNNYLLIGSIFMHSVAEI